MITRHNIRSALLLIALLVTPHVAISQDGADSKHLDDFRGSVSVTNDGISTIPNVTLGKPAAEFNMTAEKNGLRFEPELRFAMGGQPWSFVFWWRSERIRLDVGAHPAISFEPFHVTEEGASREVTEARRFLAGEWRVR